MLALDSLVIDLIFQKGAELDPDAMVEALGGVQVAETRNILDPDMQDPRFETELCPSMPFRRRGEQRLLIIDASVAPMREDPHAEPIVPLDLRVEKERLISVCAAVPVRLGRISALGSWGDAVLVAREAQDLRAIALLSWMLDPTIDAEGRKRSERLSQAEMEHKLAVYDKRIDEQGEKTILANLAGASFERRDDLLIVSVLEADGTWDLRKSLELETALAAVDSFSLIPGARLPEDSDPELPVGDQQAVGQEPPATDDSPPVSVAETNGTLVLIFPRERFSLNVASALGRKDFDSILRRSDEVSGEQRDHFHANGAAFIAPVEFLSEVFVDGKPLTRPQFDETASTESNGVRSLQVHCPRFGPVLLLDVPDRGRFIAAGLDDAQRVVELLPAAGGGS